MLYEFYGEECSHCQKMLRLTDKLMKEFPDLKVMRKEVWHNKENEKKEEDKLLVPPGIPPQEK